MMMTYGSTNGGNGSSYAGTVRSSATAQADTDSLNYADPMASYGEAPDSAADVAEGAPQPHAYGIGPMLSENKIALGLIGAGIGWLLFSAARKTETYDRAAHWAEERTAQARERLRRQYHDLSHRLEEGLHEAGHRIDEAAHELSDKTSALRARAKSRLARARHSRQLHELEKRYASYGESAYGFDYEDDAEGNRRYHRIVAESEAMAQRARRRAARINRSFWDMVDEHPLSAGLAGLAVGAAIGACLPATRREDEMMGKYRDDLLEEALAKGRRTAEKVATVAKEASHAGAEAAARKADAAAVDQGLKAGAM
jgi:signal transduction histidine kinase